jgi:cell division protein ZipA
LLAAGILILAVIFWTGKREAAGRPVRPTDTLRRTLPRLGTAEEDGASREATEQQQQASEKAKAPEEPGRIVAIRLTGHGKTTFSGDALLTALDQAGLRHGRFGIFHRHDPNDEQQILFSVANLVEPGTFDLERVKTERCPGISLFMTLRPHNALAAFDDMLSTARSLAVALEGELLDENGSRLSVQRERYLREEIIRFGHDLSPS